MPFCIRVANRVFKIVINSFKISIIMLNMLNTQKSDINMIKKVVFGIFHLLLDRN